MTEAIATDDGAVRGKRNDEVTDKINYYFSEHIRQQGLKTMDTHKFADPEFGFRMEFLNTFTGYTAAGTGAMTVSYGF